MKSNRAFAQFLGGWFLVVGLAMGAELRVIVVTPHVDAIRNEFGRGFREWHAKRFGEPAAVEWRNVGGTADAVRFLQSEFSRKPEGIGIDCLFGGGMEPYLLLDDKNLLEPYKPPAEIIDPIPQSVMGMDAYDPEFAWFGAAFSSFGILQNKRVQALLGLPLARSWQDLTNPSLMGWVGAGDPRNSGTMNVMFEAFLQYFGWEEGWRVLTQLGGNIRKFDRVSSSTAKDVTLGETGYAFAIDFYGFSQVAAAGRTNLTFVLPDDFTALNPDGIAILKGAPNLKTAQRFIDFVLGDDGQKLWFLPRGHPEGPRQYSIERMAMRPDFYRRYKGVSNIEFSPFELKQTFRYDARLSRERREVVAALVGALLVDTHEPLQAAWKHINARGRRGNYADSREVPPLTSRPTGFSEWIQQLGTAPLTEAEALALARGPWKDARVRNRKKIEWQTWAQHKYRRLCALP